MAILLALGVICLGIFAVGFVAGLVLFVGWVISSISNDNDYGVRK